MYQEPPVPGPPGEDGPGGPPRDPPWGRPPRTNRVRADNRRLQLQQRWRLWRLKKEEILKKWIKLDDWAKGVGGAGAGDPIGAGVGFHHLMKEWEELIDEWRKIRFDMRGALRREPAQPEPGNIEDEARALREELEELRRAREK